MEAAGGAGTQLGPEGLKVSSSSLKLAHSLLNALLQPLQAFVAIFSFVSFERDVSEQTSERSAVSLRRLTILSYSFGKVCLAFPAEISFRAQSAFGDLESMQDRNLSTRS